MPWFWPWSKKARTLRRLTQSETIRTFQPTDDFEDVIDGRRSVYRRDRSYNLRPGNVALAEKCAEWEAEGLIVWKADVRSVVPAGGAALTAGDGRIEGTGKAG